jgi:hypothetical protein
LFVYDDDKIVALTVGDNRDMPVGDRVIAVTASRRLDAEDDGCVLDCVAPDLTLTVPASLPLHFACLVIPNGTTSFASADDTILNGGTTTVTRSSESNATVAILTRALNAGYLVTRE